MKKFLVATLMALIGCMTSFAGDDMKVTDGSLAPLKEGGIATITINMADTKFDNKIPLREDSRFADIDKVIPEFESEFVREFNEHAKKFKMTKEEFEAQYKFTLDVTNLDVYINVFSFKGGVGTKIWGTLTISKGNEKVAVVTLKSFESSGITYAVSLEETFEVFAKDLAKKINKGK